jgi:hypothetical protein
VAVKLPSFVAVVVFPISWSPLCIVHLSCGSGPPVGVLSPTHWSGPSKNDLVCGRCDPPLPGRDEVFVGGKVIWSPSADCHHPPSLRSVRWLWALGFGLARGFGEVWNNHRSLRPAPFVWAPMFAKATSQGSLWRSCGNLSYYLIFDVRLSQIPISCHVLQRISFLLFLFN